MEIIVLGISIGLIVTTIITALTAKPCPREELGYKCRRGTSQKCECEK